MITHSAYGRSTFKLFRRTQNDLDFLLKDIDRQPVNPAGDLVFHIWDSGGNALLSKTLTVANPQRGHYRLSFTASESLAIRSGIYVWSVTNENADMIKLLYTNQDYGSQGVLEVVEGLMVPAARPYDLLFDDLTRLDGMRYTSALPGSARADTPTGNHTVVVWATDYTGALVVEATLDETYPTGDNDWIEVERTVLVNQLTPFVLNFEGNYSYVRFQITDANGCEKLVYRN